MADLIIRDARVITGGVHGKILERATIVVEDGKIVEVSERPSGGYKADRVIDGRGKLAIPGLVNVHVHTDETLGMNTVPDTISHIPWFERWILPYYESQTSDDRYWSAVLSHMLMLKSGTTCYADSANRNPELAAKAASETGIRAFVAHWVSDIGSYLPSSIDECVRKTKNLLKGYSDRRSKVRAIASVIGLNQCSNELYLEIKKLADEYSVSITSHESSGHEDVLRSIKRIGLRPVENLEKIGFLSGRTLLSHLTDVSKREVDLVRKSGASVVLSPAAEMKKGKGLWKYGKLSKMMESDINICLGTDTANSSNHLDVLRAATLLLFAAKDIAKDPAVLKAEQALDMVTANAGKALGLENYGSIANENVADIALFDLDAVEWFSNFDPLQGLLYGSTQKTYATIVGGEVVYEDGRFMKIDQSMAIRKIKKHSEHLTERMQK
ncbi:MAG: amidohydrolase family protein [Nitrososphaerota archaeon]|nr:amidohydrolase family protein [Nitrososphaerota archaeon]